jgi:hypothetical protein
MADLDHLLIISVVIAAPKSWRGSITFNDVYEEDFKNLANSKTQAYTTTFIETVSYIYFINREVQEHLRPTPT